jgi:C1A family cysteine protease
MSATIPAKRKNIYNLKVERQPEHLLDYLQIPKVCRLPTKVDLRSKMPPVYDQGNLGSCTAQALCGLVGYDNPEIHGSRLFVYYNERVLENHVSQDTGATLADGIKTLQKHGVCEETLWPYNPANFAVCPPKTCYNAALQHVALQVKNIRNDLTTMKSSLCNGCPFVVGFLVYKSFESAYVTKTGYVPMPSAREQLLGGHAVVCVGYDDTKNVFIMRNSWGTNWGDKGYFYLPYAYLTSTKLASDLWNIIKMK